MAAGDTTPIPTTGTDLARSIDPLDSTAAQDKAVLAHPFDNTPTSIDEENDNLGRPKHSLGAPQDSFLSGGQRGDTDD